MEYGEYERCCDGYKFNRMELKFCFCCESIHHHQHHINCWQSLNTAYAPVLFLLAKDFPLNDELAAMSFVSLAST